MMWRSVPQSGGLGSAQRREVSPRLVDDFLESYVSWREEAAAVRGAYADWRAAPEQDELFVAYGEALDREEHAAGLLRESAERIATTEEVSGRTSC
jgi:hypothetical protein